jgi:hypothetical protein
MFPTLTRRVLAFLELSPDSLERLGLPGTVLKVNHLWEGPPLSREKLQEVCRVVWQTHQARLAVMGQPELNEPAITFGVLVSREPVL